MGLESWFNADLYHRIPIALIGLTVTYNALAFLYRRSLPDTLSELQAPPGANLIGGHLNYVLQ